MLAVMVSVIVVVIQELLRLTVFYCRFSVGLKSEEQWGSHEVGSYRSVFL